MISLLKERTYDKRIDEFKLAECVICFEEFQRGVSVRKIPICRHIFHTVCIDGWFRAKINEATHHCPLCNASINYRILMEAIKKKKEESRANFTQKIGDGVQRVR